MLYDPFDSMIGGFSAQDGTIDFYLRVNSLAEPHHTVLDLGAGRAGWFVDDECQVRRDIRMLKGKVHKVIAADVDEVVLENLSSDEQLVISNGEIGLEKDSIDIIVADYVLEHIEDVEDFVNQIDHCLKSGGWFCARTPHKYSYISSVSRLIDNGLHSKFLKKIQPGRKEIDVFPAYYRLNTLNQIQTAFSGWNSGSFIYPADPSYYFGSRFVFGLQKIAHRIMFAEFSGNLFIYVQKP